MDTMGERLKRAMTLRGVKPADLVRQKVLSKAGIYFLLNGTTTHDKVRATTIAKVCKALNINRDWLLHGRGPIEGDHAAANDPKWRSIKASTQGLAAGGGRVPDEYADTHELMFRTSSLQKQGLKPDKLEVHYARGDSMLPRIRDGDAMLIDTSDTRIRDGKIYWIRHEGHDFVKILHKAGKSVVIESMNKAHPEHAKPVLVQPGDEFEVLGKMRWVGSWED